MEAIEFLRKIKGEIKMFEAYDKDDIINELFCFTDALRDEGALTTEEEDMLDELRDRYYDICEGRN